jgi:hypothetical protein
MSISSSEFRAAILDKLLGLLWRQWSAIGVAGYSAAEESKVVDPEALLLLTMAVGRYDARLFDGALDWLFVNGDFLNVQRLQNLAKQSGTLSQAAISAAAEMLGRKSSVALKWKKLASTYVLAEETPLFFMIGGRPMPTPARCDEIFRRHGILRPPVQPRNLARPFPREGMPALLLRLRALFGVSIRCEILCLLGSQDEIHPARIAKLLGHVPRTTQNLLVEMARSGVVQVRTSAREKIYALAPGALDDLLRPAGSTPWVNSVPLFRAMEILWLGLSDPDHENLDDLLLASQWRRLARDIKPLLGDAGLGQPLREDTSFAGEEYYPVFVEDMTRILERL